MNLAGRGEPFIFIMPGTRLGNFVSENQLFHFKKKSFSLSRTWYTTILETPENESRNVSNSLNVTREIYNYDLFFLVIKERNPDSKCHQSTNSYTRHSRIYPLNFSIKIPLYVIFLYYLIGLYLFSSAITQDEIPRINKRYNRSELLPDYGSDCRKIAAAPRYNNSKLIAVLAVIIFSYAQRSPRDRRAILLQDNDRCENFITPANSTCARNSLLALLIRTGCSALFGYDLFYSITKFAFLNKCNEMNIFIFSFFFESFNNTWQYLNYLIKYKISGELRQ